MLLGMGATVVSGLVFWITVMSLSIISESTITFSLFGSHDNFLKLLFVSSFLFVMKNEFSTAALFHCFNALLLLRRR